MHALNLRYPLQSAKKNPLNLRNLRANYALLKRLEVFDGFVHGVYHACQLSFGEFPLCGVSHHGMCRAQAVVLLTEIDQLGMRSHHLLPQAAVLLRKQ